MRRVPALVTAAALAAGGCAALLSLDEVTYVGGARDADGTDDAAPRPDASGEPDAGRDGGGDGAPCTADPRTDPRNCGACNRDCLGGTCIDGGCQPFELARGLSAPGELAVDDTYVYWEVDAPTPGNRNVLRCHRSGCTVGEPAIVAQDVPPVQTLATAAGSLVLQTQSPTQARVDVCDPSNCLPTTRVIDTSDAAVGFTRAHVTEGHFYWGRALGGEIRRAPLDGGPPEQAAVPGCWLVTVGTTASDVLWICQSSRVVRRCTLPCATDGGSPYFDAGNAVVSFERSGSFVVLAGGGSIWLLEEPDAGPAAARVLVASGAGDARLVGDRAIYAYDPDRSVETCQLPACASRAKIVRDVNARRLAADARAVFWTDRDAGIVMGVAR
jgi:hypothetical protein